MGILTIKKVRIKLTPSSVDRPRSLMIISPIIISQTLPRETQKSAKRLGYPSTQSYDPSMARSGFLEFQIPSSQILKSIHASQNGNNSANLSGKSVLISRDETINSKMCSEIVNVLCSMPFPFPETNQTPIPFSNNEKTQF